MGEHFEIIIKFLPLITALIAGIIAIYLAILNYKKETLQKMYFDLIFPIFDLLENELYSKNPSKQTIISINEIINKNKALASRRLIYLAEKCKEPKNKNAYKDLCEAVSYRYDYLCSRLGIQRRTELYKIQRNQFPNKISLIIASIAFLGKIILIILGLISYILLTLTAYLLFMDYFAKI